MVADGSDRRPVRRLLPLAIAALAATASAAEFQCAPLKPSESRRPAYTRIGEQARCEGFYDRSVSQPFIEIISLTSGTAPADGATVLTLSTPTRVAARLIVQPLRPAPFYRVDALVPAGQALSWDTAPMLSSTGLRVRDLGFLASQVAGGAGSALIPVTIGRATAAPADGPSLLQAVLRVSVPVASLAWRRQRMDGSAGTWRDIPGPARFAWERVPLALEMPPDGGGVRVDVQAVDADGKVLPMLRFSVSGLADGSP